VGEKTDGCIIVTIKVVAFLGALVGMLGFGLCGLVGVGAGLGNDAGIVALGLAGLAIAVAFFFAARAILRSGQRRRP
jgi:tellurite resistance protein TehA-like permease